MSPSLADSSWQETHEKTSSSKIICKYLIWLCNSLSFCFIPLPPFLFQPELLILTFAHKGQFSPALLEPTEKSSQGDAVSGWVWLSSLHQDTCISIHLCHGSWHMTAGEETKYSTTHVSDVHESHFYFSTQKYVTFPPWSNYVTFLWKTV